MKKLEKNKNPNRSKLRGIFNVCSESKVTASSGVQFGIVVPNVQMGKPSHFVLDPSQTNKKMKLDVEVKKRVLLLKKRKKRLGQFEFDDSDHPIHEKFTKMEPVKE